MRYQSLRVKITSGIPVRRGTRPLIPGKRYATDPGDFGRGVYYFTNYHAARNYGLVTKSTLKLKNPLILTDEEAYQLAEQFGTVGLSEERIMQLFLIHGKGKLRDAIDDELFLNAQAMTDTLVGGGFDGLVAIKRHGLLEIVEYKRVHHD